MAQSLLAIVRFWAFFGPKNGPELTIVRFWAFLVCPGPYMSLFFQAFGLGPEKIKSMKKNKGSAIFSGLLFFSGWLAPPPR